VALAVPVLACFTVLLMAADSVFSSFVLQLTRLPFDVTRIVPHLMLAGFVAWVCAGGLLAALDGESRSVFGALVESLCRWSVGLVYRPAADTAAADLPSEGATHRLVGPPPIALGPYESVTVLVLVDALFGIFMAIQGAYFFGGLDTLARSGMTYAEYARRGFFELVAVACLALGLLCGLAVLTRRQTPGARRAFNLASLALILLVMGLLVSAFERMTLYEQAYGYSQLRLYTHSFMLWLGVVLLLFLAALLRGAPRIFTHGGVAAALIYLAVLNIANPDALVVQQNVARYQATGDIDADYLGSLSADATPALVESLGVLGEGPRATLAAALAQQYQQLQDAAGQGWPGWNLGRALAVRAIAGARSR
jgi:hypothetical protein